MTASTAHLPVMRDEVIRYLAPRAGGVYVDGTFGRGGYARAILAQRPARLFGFDRDHDAIAAGADLARENLSLTLIHGRFGAMRELLASHDVREVDGIALDLGISSPQIDEAERGFSFGKDGPLDMRMDQSAPRTAADIVNETPEKELADIIYSYGDEHYSRRIAHAIVAVRAETKIVRTLQLAEIVRRIVPRAKDGIDPATRTFQALRIAVNDELGELKDGLRAAEELLRPQGRLVVVSFHALEDRAVKDFLRARGGKAGGSRHLPQRSAALASFKELTRKSVAPDAAEIAANPRARSARLRAAEKIGGGAAP